MAPVPMAVAATSCGTGEANTTTAQAALIKMEAKRIMSGKVIEERLKKSESDA